MRQLLIRRLVRCAAALGVLVAALAMSGVASPKTGVTTVRVAVTAADAVPIYLGKAQGVFAKAGLEVRVVKESSSISAVNAVLHGKADFGAGDSARLLYAASTATNLRLVAGSTTATNGLSAVLVLAGSSITSPAGLTNISVGVPEANGLAQIETPAWLADVASVDGTSDTFSVVSSARAVAALKAGTVQAVVTTWPYTAKTAGVRNLGDPVSTELGPGATTSAWFATSSTLSSKAALAKSFVSAVGQAIAGMKNKALAKRAIAATGAPATAVALKYAAKLNSSSLDDIGLLLLTDGLVTEQPDTQALTWRHALSG